MQRSKNWGDRWRCGRERAVTVWLGSSNLSEERMPRNMCLVCQTTRCKDPFVIFHRSQAIKWSTSGAALVTRVNITRRHWLSQLYSDGSFSTAPPSIASVFTALHVYYCIAYLDLAHAPSSSCPRSFKNVYFLNELLTKRVQNGDKKYYGSDFTFNYQ